MIEVTEKDCIGYHCSNKVIPHSATNLEEYDEDRCPECALHAMRADLYEEHYLDEQ